MKYTFFWLDGKRDVFEGDSPADALTHAGYGGGALRALDFFSPGDDYNYKWDSENHTWKTINHYEWLEKHLQTFFQKIGVDHNNGIIVAHADKCGQYKEYWNMCGIPFHYGVALYLLSYIHPYSKDVRTTPDGWVPPDEWVATKYEELKHIFDELS